MGNLEQAKENYEKALVLALESIPVLTVLAELETNTGNFTKAAGLLEEALQAARKAKDRFRVYGSLSNFHEFRGRVGKALDYQKRAVGAFEEFSVPLMVLFVKTASIESYVRAGEEEEALRVLASIESQLKPPFDKYTELGYLLLYLEMEKPDEAEKHLPGFRQLIKTLGAEMLESMLHKARARIHEMRGQYAEAIKSYETQLKTAPGNEGGLRGMGRCYRRLKEYDKAEEYIQKTLKISPFDPKSNYELGLVYLDMGDKEKALKHLQTAVDVWKDADPVYKPARRAKEKLAELK
ncbi:MAG: tetratricopeptide repeat protein [bacterium]|nr:tetratricopeptide repeat protein [bacterium]